MMKRRRGYLIFLILGISFLTLLLFFKLGNPEKLLFFVYEIQADVRSKVPAYRSKQSHFDFIANRSWTHMSATGPFGTEGEVWIFYGDGSFEFSIISDFTFNLEGMWKIVDVGNNQGLLYLDYYTDIHKGNENISVRRKQVVFIEAKYKHLNFNFEPFWGEELSTTITNPTTVMVDSAFIQKDFPAYSLLLEKKWVKDNDVFTDKHPHELTFFDDGTFHANYVRDTPCNFMGNWSIHELEPDRVEIRLSAPDARCDLTGHKGYGWGGGNYFSITDTALKSESSTTYDYHAK